MKILIIHISDLHLTENSNLVEKANKLVDSIKYIETEIIQVIFAITGDLAFSGRELEYYLVADFLDTLKESSINKICKNVQFVIVPGNHDCLFSKDNEDARDQIIESLRSKDFVVTGKSILDICLNNQQNFFTNCFDFYCLEPALNLSRLFYQFSFEINGFKTSFNCLNSAWISKLKENLQYGKLGYPLEYLRDSIDSDFCFSLLHHPLNWFTLNNSKELKRYLVTNSDIILTGHEHEPDQSNFNNYKGKTNVEFIEGGIFNNAEESNKESNKESSFNAICIDISANLHKIYQYNFSFTEEIFLCEVITDWIPNNHNKKPNKYKLNRYHEKWLSDPGATIYYQYNDESLSLDEIFIFPELKETFTEEEEIKFDDKVGSELLLETDSKPSKFFILGSEFIGKTILLKKLFCEYYKNGLIPVYIEGKEIKDTSPDAFKNLVIDCVTKQYGNNELERIKQEDHSKFYILIDNFHQCNLPLKYKSRFIDSNFNERDDKQVYPNVIICGNDYMQFEELIYKDEQTLNPLIYFKSYKLLPFGVRMRYKLIEKWYRNKRRNLEETELIQKIEQAERLIDSNLGNNFIPKYPLFILVHLHNIDLERQTELKTSSYGYYYEYLIVTSISRKDPEMLDSYMTYLTQFAYFLFDNKAHDITLEKFEYFDKEVFRKTRRIAKEFSAIVDFFKKVGILEEKNQLLKIKHNFIYYYFLARYLRDTIASKKTRDVIRSLVKKLYKDENSNILIFLTHLSKDNFILETLIDASKKIFSDFQPLQINGDCNSIDSLVENLPKLLVENEDIRKNREDYRKKLESSEKLSELPDYNTSDNSEDENDGKEILNNIRISLKALQVLGQIGKNYHGSLTITQLQNVIEEAYLLGLRTLNSYIVYLESNTESIVSLIGDRLDEILSEKNIRITEEKKNKLAKNLVFSFCLMLIWNFIKRISFAIGTIKLKETYKEIYDKYDWSSIKLIDISIKLDHFDFLPIKDIIDSNKYLKKKKLSSILLNILVKFYLEMHPAKIEHLQMLSKELGLDMKTLRLIAYKQKHTD